MPITLEEYDKRLAYLRSKGSQMFRIKFKKRTTGEERIMICRLGVKKGVKGVQKDRKQRDRNNRLVTVFDMQKQQFRCVPLDDVIEVSE